MPPSAAADAGNTAVAGNPGKTSTVGNRTGEPAAVAGNTSDDESSARTSIAGDPFATASALSSVEETEPEPEVVANRRGPPLAPNCGLYFSNWELIRPFRDDAQARRQLMKQFRKIPAQILVVVGARQEVAALLEEVKGGGDRHVYKVVQGNEPVSILIAARDSSCNDLRLLRYEVHDDHQYKEKGKPRIARSRMLVCTVEFRQPIPHIGTSVNVLGVHGSNRTMKMEWPTAFDEFWDRCALWITNFSVKFMAGDFNMALTQVVTQLRRRGIQCDCCAWYPWRHASEEMHGQSLGFYSCGIFYIGGQVEVRLDWGIDRIDELTAVAEEMRQSDLDVYVGPITPGQHWACYKSKRNEKDHEKDLTQKLVDLLQPSTPLAELQAIAGIPESHIGSYLRIKQQALSTQATALRNFAGDTISWRFNAICAFTNNGGTRGWQEGQQRAAEKGGKGFHKGKGKGDEGKGKGKGKGKGDAEKGCWKGRVGESAAN